MTPHPAKPQSAQIGIARIAFVTTLICLGSLGSARAENSCKYIRLATMPVEMKELVPTVQGSINSTPAQMLIDSGAPSTLLTQVEKAQLGLSGDTANATRKHGRNGSASGNNANDTMTALTELSVGPIELGTTHLLTAPSLTDHANFGSVVGADFLFQHDMEMSLHDKQINFFKPDHCEGKTLSYWDGNAITVPLEPISNNDHRQTVTVEINGQQLHAVIDTGTPLSVIHIAAAARLGVTPQSPGVNRIVPKNSPAGAASTSNAWLAPFTQFSIGDETIKNVKIPIANLRDGNHATTPDMLLGADFINAHHLLFAVSQHQLYLSYLGGPVFGADTAPAVAQQ